MAGERSYLDYNASAPLIPAARAAVSAALEVAGNASSLHAEGRAARQLVEAARRDVAALVNTKPTNVVFTSGATESAAMLLTPKWRMGRAPLSFARLYVSAGDHACILGGGRFAPDRVVRVPLLHSGLIDTEALQNALSTHDGSDGLPLVAVHAANNETGVIQPIAEIAAAVSAAGGVLVVDAAQAAGRIPLDVSMGCGDFLILSSHKIGGPKGAGAIVGKADLMMPEPLIAGGGQERGHRGGTENIAAIAGFAAAAREARDLGKMALVEENRQRIERIVLDLVPDAVIFASAAPRLANTVFFEIPGMKAETALIAFDLAGVAVSAGSACSSGRLGPSHVLVAMGYGDEAAGIRVSIGRETGEAEVDHFRRALEGIAARRTDAPRAA